MKECDYLRAVYKCIARKSYFVAEKMDTMYTHMLSYTNTRGIKSRARELIQQMVIAEKVSIFKPNRLKGVHIYQKQTR